MYPPAKSTEIEKQIKFGILRAQSHCMKSLPSTLLCSSFSQSHWTRVDGAVGLSLRRLQIPWLTSLGLYITGTDNMSLVFAWSTVGPKHSLSFCLFYAVFLMLIKRIWMNEWMNEWVTAWSLNYRCMYVCYFVVQRLLLGLGVLTSQLRCYVDSIVCHTCVGWRFDMPLIKRILIDWLIKAVFSVLTKTCPLLEHQLECFLWARNATLSSSSTSLLAANTQNLQVLLKRMKGQ